MKLISTNKFSLKRLPARDPNKICFETKMIVDSKVYDYLYFLKVAYYGAVLGMSINFYTRTLRLEIAKKLETR